MFLNFYHDFFEIVLFHLRESPRCSLEFRFSNNSFFLCFSPELQAVSFHFSIHPSARVITANPPLNDKMREECVFAVKD